jgi:hypothetical protein
MKAGAYKTAVVAFNYLAYRKPNSSNPWYGLGNSLVMYTHYAHADELMAAQCFQGALQDKFSNKVAVELLKAIHVLTPV